ncbi:hypothetical protein EJ04DRAFT_517142 [Polyplosphaeria fusca]|uniref:Uncharacterized protein n=1 Tax=Polyplosphaeria fusca TaxID=682080 RepID=A0A9P4UW72_9PLEO|nr:hypothetical protein EJ04DRAFT_517142 [Polyplosphaeria fusca]
MDLIRNALSHSPIDLPGFSSSGGVTVTVGKPNDAEEFFISSRVLKECPALRQNLDFAEGSCITSLDASIFRAIVESIETKDAFKKLSFSPQDALKFAKFWEHANTLGYAAFQNRVTEKFQSGYRELLEKRASVQPEQESITYLRNHVGFHSPAEQLIIDSYAGLLQWHTDISLKLQALSPDTALHIKERWDIVVSSRGVQDRVVGKHDAFRVSKDQMARHRRTIQMLPPSKAILGRPQTPGTKASTPLHSSSQKPALPRSESTSSLTQRIRMMIPGLNSTNSDGETLVPDRVPSPMRPLLSTPPNPRPRSSASDRAPFMPPSPHLSFRTPQKIPEDDESSDDELVDYFNDVFKGKMSMVEREFDSKTKLLDDKP